LTINKTGVNLKSKMKVRKNWLVKALEKLRQGFKKANKDQFAASQIAKMAQLGGRLVL